MKSSARNFGILFVLLSVLEIVTLSLGVTSIHQWIKPLLIPSLAAAALCVFNGVEFPLRHAVVMGTYLIAEWLLVSAMVRNRLQSGEAA